MIRTPDLGVTSVSEPAPRAAASNIQLDSVEVHPTIGSSTAHLIVRGRLADPKQDIFIGVPRLDFANRTARIELKTGAPNAWRPGEKPGTFDRRVDLFSIAYKGNGWKIELVDAKGTSLARVTL